MTRKLLTSRSEQEKTKDVSDDQGQLKRQVFIWKKKRIQEQPEKETLIPTCNQNLVATFGAIRGTPSRTSHTAMSLNETPIENHDHTTSSPGGTTVIQGEGINPSERRSRKYSYSEITPEFIARNREQILLLLQKEEKERQLKEVRTQLEFEDCSTGEEDEEYVETEPKPTNEVLKTQTDLGGAKKKEEEKKVSKKLEPEDDYSKPYRPSTARARDRTPKKYAQLGWNPSKGQGERIWPKPHFQPRFVPREPFQPRFGTPRKPAIDAEVKLPSLTKTPSEILATENVKFTKPTPLRPGPRKNMDKYCEFHKENGHATDDCFSLRRQIESAIKTGKLSHLIKELQKVPQVGEKRKEIFMLRATEEKRIDEIWNLHTDGASNDEGSGAGLILVGPDQLEVTYALKLDFRSSNNEAEYEALLAGLRLACRMKVRKLKAHVDSMLVANQVNGTYDAKEPAMKLRSKQPHDKQNTWSRNQKSTLSP
ncbi:hypothetical protein E3N88_19343 [Mikania micrantha]|uniref:RNase H type-1 domain-containing protein n=1 Tax=Mikania micrantha TaxID=192012 RepID=A0A5N6NQY5_9ASTR|nr:hypothetical protein E3N88_19343 [Mikania micrantha]